MPEQVVPTVVFGSQVLVAWLVLVGLRAGLAVVRCGFWPWDARDRARGFERQVGGRLAAL